MKKGQLALALVGVAGLCSSAAFGQSDACATATSIGNGIFAYDLTGATNEGNTAGQCGTTGVAQDLWWAYTASGAGTLTVSTCAQTSADSVLALWADCSTPIVCNDDACGIQSTVSTTVTAGQVVLIRVADYNGGAHIGSINVVGPGAPPPPPPPPGDACASAEVVTDGSYPFDLSLCSNEGNAGASCGQSAAGPDYWFSYTAAASGTLIASTCGGTGDDTVLSVFSNCSTQVACNDDSCNYQSEVAYPIAAGQTVLIRVAGYGGDVVFGNINFTLNTAPPCAVSQPTGSVEEAEACGDDTNGGCNAPSPVFEELPCSGAVIFGHAWANGGTRDTDWYTITTYGEGDIGATINAESPMGVFITDNACPPNIIATAFGTGSSTNCQDITAVAVLMPAGTYRVIALPAGAGGTGIYDGLPCSNVGDPSFDRNEYVLTVTTTGSCTPTGACCTSSGCQIVTAADCTNLGGQYLGDGAACATPGTYQLVSGVNQLEDISATGTDLFGGDDSSTNVSLPFSFTFDGVPYSDMWVCSNGFISFGASYNAWVNAPIPSSGVPNGALYVHWEDFNFVEGGQLFYEVRGVAGVDQRAIVQWNNVPQWGIGDSNTFQCILYENGSFEYRYATVPGDGDVTAGWENVDGTVAASVDPFTVTSGTSVAGSYLPGSSNCNTCSWQADGCYPDYDNNGGIDGDDVIAFFSDWDAASTCADVDGSGGTDGDDVISFFGAWDASGVGYPGC